MRIRVECLECGKEFRTASMLPECPKCGGSDIEVASESRVFDTRSIESLKAAENYKAKLENKFNSVLTTSVGFERVKIEGRKGAQ